jgi:outer membrane protein OmpA-like peptidoglycan-associated protein
MAAGLLLASPHLLRAEIGAPVTRAQAQTPLIPLPEAERRMLLLLRFERGESSLDADHYAQLAPVLERLRTDPRAVVTITSHAQRMAFEIARARAASVRRAIMGQGIAARRIRVVNAGMAAGVDPDVVQLRVR